MKVMKFGGTSVGSVNSILSVQAMISAKAIAAKAGLDAQAGGVFITHLFFIILFSNSDTKKRKFLVISKLKNYNFSTV